MFFFNLNHDLQDYLFLGKEVVRLDKNQLAQPVGRFSSDENGCELP